MASIQLTGDLDLPLQADSATTKLRFTCSAGMNTVLKTAPQVYITDAQGHYDMQLMYGMHIIEVLYDGQWNFLGNVNVTEQTPSPIDLNTLLGSHSVPIPGEEAGLPSYNAMNLRGNWDPSSGNFPPDPMYPTELSDVWTITANGTMGTDFDVATNDLIYWSLEDQEWKVSGSSDSVDLGDGELLVGTAGGGVEAQTFASLFAGMTRLYVLDGTLQETTITHNKNRKVVAVFFNEYNKIEYPIYKQTDPNTLTIVAGEPLLGTLLVI